MEYMNLYCFRYKKRKNNEKITKFWWFYVFLQPKRYICQRLSSKIVVKWWKLANFKIRFLSNYLGKTLQKWCVWKLLTHKFCFCISRAPASISRTCTGLDVLGCPKWRFCHFGGLRGHSLSYTCSWNARRCSHFAKMQNIGQGLSNAPNIKYFE